MLDINFDLSEGETSDKEGVGIALYLRASIVNPNTALSMRRLVAPYLLSSKTILSILNGGEESSLIE